MPGKEEVLQKYLLNDLIKAQISEMTAQLSQIVVCTRAKNRIFCLPPSGLCTHPTALCPPPSPYSLLLPPPGMVRLSICQLWSHSIFASQGQQGGYQK